MANLPPRERLERLVRAGVRITAERITDDVLQEVVDSARDVIGARYAALGVLDSTASQLTQFVVSGVTPEEYARIGSLPSGKGILGLLISDPRPIRLHDLERHSRAHGFPEHHPDMHSFLGVPIIGRKGPIGNLYLTEKVGADEFSKEDEAIAVMLAAQAAVAVENARLYAEADRMVMEMAALQAQRDRFFAMINHELRNALTAVYGWSDLLLRKLGPDGPRAAREVYDSAERTLGLLNDLLDLSRMEAARLALAPKEADATALLVDAIASVEPTANGRHVMVEANVDGPVPCRADAQRTRQILINLLSNAVRHSPENDCVTVKLRATDTHMTFSVSDRGDGIPADRQAEIFEAFRSSSPEQRGTGLGLTLSRQLARLMGGDLTVTSEPGAGSTFILDIPRWPTEL